MWRGNYPTPDRPHVFLSRGYNTKQSEVVTVLLAWLGLRSLYVLTGEAGLCC